MQQTIHAHNRAHRAMPAQPITYGVPWPKGAITDVANLAAVDDTGAALPAAFTVLNTWPDGSAQWTLMDLALDLKESDDRAVTVTDSAPPAGPPRQPVTVEQDGDTATLSNGLVALRVTAKAGRLLESWTAHGREVVKADGFDITFEDGDGHAHSLKAGPRTLTIEHANPLRAVLRVDGRHGRTSGEGDLLDYFLRIELRAGRDDVKITHSFRNRELPMPGIAIRNFYATFDTAIKPGAKRCFTANTRTRHYLTMPMRVDEDPDIIASDTGDVDNYAGTHKDRERADSFVRNAEVLHDPPEEKPWWLRDPKFRLQAGGSKCVWPYLALLDDTAGVLACMPEMICLHPKQLTSRGSTLRFGIWPDWAGDLDITQGAGRSHTMHIAPLASDVSDEQIQTRYLSWEFGGVHTHVTPGTPVEISPDLDHVRRCEVFSIDKLPAYDLAKNFGFERKVLDAWIGVSYGQLGAVDQVAPWSAAGFWHYGDNGLGNNEEMNARVYFENYFRTGNWGCAEKAMAATVHMMEVDHCAFSTDALQTGGQVAHTTAHNNGTAYPSHEWFTEYLCAYVLTGDREFLDTAKRACEHLLFWIDDDECFQIISADQREAGQPMINLTWCYHFTKDPRYLDGCWKIVREYLMANTKKFGRMLDARPPASPVKICSYGDYAAWEGMYFLWEITRDEELKDFMLSQLQWRLTHDHMGTHGFHRVTDYNHAAYAYHMTGDDSWLTRVARPFRYAFRTANWPLGWVHAMYYIKLAFDHGIVTDDDVIAR